MVGPALAVLLLLMLGMAGCISENKNEEVIIGSLENAEEVGEEYVETGEVLSSVVSGGTMFMYEFSLNRGQGKVNMDLRLSDILYNTTKGSLKLKGRPSVWVGFCKGMDKNDYLEGIKSGNIFRTKDCNVSNKVSCETDEFRLGENDVIKLKATCPYLPGKDKVGWIGINATVEYGYFDEYLNSSKRPDFECAEVEKGKRFLCTAYSENMWASR